MTPQGFVERLSAGRPVYCTYRAGGSEGLLSAWPHAGGSVLTWEECRAGGRYDEAGYARDERHAFRTAAEVLAFVERSGHSASAFGP